MGLGLLIGSAVPKGRSVWLYSSLAILLAVMVVQYDPGLHGGHMDLIAARVRTAWQPGDCIQYGDDFSRVAAGYNLTDLPVCQAHDRSWLITTQAETNRVEFAHTDGWHFTAIIFYAPLDHD